MKQRIESNAYSKPLSFSTTMRNPNRIASFINCLLPYENKILTNDIIMEIVEKIIGNKLYRPLYVGRTLNIKNVFDSDDVELTKAQINEIIVNSPQNHKEAGFDKGWPSRFDTWFKLPMEFGFICYEMNKPIQITNVGHMLIDAINEKPINEYKIQNIFLNSMIKYQIPNPFRKNANKNNPLLLLLNVIKLLKEDVTQNDAGIFKQELSLFICWKNNNAEELYKYIVDLRKQKGFNYSDEFIFDKCLDLLGVTERPQIRFKISQICGEAVDEYIRKMRTTGIISLRGNGRFLDYNSFEKEKIDYIINNYGKLVEFADKSDYLKYVGEIDNKILEFKETESNIQDDVKLKKLNELAETYNEDTIIKELIILTDRKTESKDKLFRYIPAPTRLEFLTSIVLKQKLKNVEILPNYSVDDEGLPTFTASGNKSDIVCKNLEMDSLVEVTLMCGAKDQVHNEIIPIARHLAEYIKQNAKSTFSIFIAPVIHEDTKNSAEWIGMKNNVLIIPYNIVEFLEKLKGVSELAEFSKVI